MTTDDSNEPRTTVVNLHDEPFEVYIGRAGNGRSGYFGSPIRFRWPCPVCQRHHGRSGTLECFEKYARTRIEEDPEYRERVKGLHGKVLGCFCKPLPCHGDILATIADELHAADKED